MTSYLRSVPRTSMLLDEIVPPLVSGSRGGITSAGGAGVSTGDRSTCDCE